MLDSNDTKKIARMHAKARSYTDSDPEVALMIARKTAEAICKVILVEKMNEDRGVLMLERLIEQLGTGKHVPRGILTHLRTIQLHGNFGVHDQGDDNTEIDTVYVRPCMQSLDYACDWFFGKFVPPIRIDSPAVVGALARELGVKPYFLIKALVNEMNIFANVNCTIEDETARELAAQWGRRVYFI